MNSTLRTGLLVLQALITREEPVGVGELARALDRHKSNVHRVLVTLANHGFVIQDRGTRKYRVATEWTRSMLTASRAAAGTTRTAAADPAAWWMANT